MRKIIAGAIIAAAVEMGCALIVVGYKQLKAEKGIQVEDTANNTIHVDYDLAGYSSGGQSNLLQHYLESDAGEHVIARMYIPDTAMETPIVDSEYYFRRDLSGKYSTNGTPLVLTTDHFMKPNHNAVEYSKCENLEKIAERNYFLSEIKQRNAIDTGSNTYKDGDKFITLSTCHYETNRENGRLVVVAVRQ